MQMPASPSIEQRLRRVEDLLAIQQLIASYGPAADSSTIALLDRVWAEDAEYVIGGLGVHTGRADIHSAYEGEFHRDLLRNGSAHASTQPYIVIEGDHAVATHYSTLFKHQSGKFELVRLAASRWELERLPDGAWIAKRRTNRLLNGSEAARDLLAQLDKFPDQAPDVSES